MKNANVKLLTMMTSIMFLMTAAPAAFGQATPATHAVDVLPPGTQPPNTTFQFHSINSAFPAPGDITDIVFNEFYAFYTPPGGGFTPDVTSHLGCAAALPTGASEMKWILYHNDGIGGLTLVTGAHNDLGVNTPSVIFLDSIDPTLVPAIAPANPSAVAGDGFGSGSPSTTDASLFPGTTLSPAIGGGFYYWQKVNSVGALIAGPDTTAMAGDYTFAACAFLDANGSGAFDSGDGPNVVFATVFIEEPVGGELLPISATSLLVAGAGANALWILPILGLAGTIIAIRKLEA